MELEVLLLWSQVTATSHYPEPVESAPRPLKPYYPKNHFNIICA